MKTEHTKGIATSKENDMFVGEKHIGKMYLMHMKYDDRGRSIPDKEGFANAAYAMKCWNMHEELVDVLLTAKVQIEYLHEAFVSSGGTGTGLAVIAKIDELIKKSRA